jgi:predicted dehydrogenase
MAMMRKLMTRRHFVESAAMATAATWLAGCQSPRLRKLSANDKLNIGIIGTANRARSNIGGVERENIVALCDIDDNFLAAAKEKFPGAKTYNDFRRLLEQRDIDAVVVSSADHTHAVITAAALRLGKHVYCEKPLTHTVYEARTIAKLAARNKTLATQMGTQIHATENYRRVVELVQSGAIGPVRECHVWCEKSLANSERPREMPLIPPNIHWDLWLGPAPARPYHPDYLPKTWRHWWDFGEGILGDMACHYMDLPFWALKLRYPKTVEAEGPPVHPETTPEWLIARYEFPARLDLPPVALTWYDGDKRPKLLESSEVPDWRNGVLFVGDKGMLLADYGRHKLLPENKFAGFEPPRPFIPASIGHHNEWLLACKTGSPTTCNFDYASALTESVLLGNVAFRAGEKLEWNAPILKVRNSKQAMNYIRTEYRKGWEL